MLRVARFLALSAAAAAASPALAAGGFHEPRPGAALRGSSAVRIAWELPPARTAGFEEMELVLSLDGGRTFPVRVTRDLDPESRSLAFTVPNLPSTHARLALRAGDGAEPGEEQILLVSDEFAIEADSNDPLEVTFSRRGEWRTREALEPGDAGDPTLPGSVGRTVPSLDAASDFSPALSQRSPSALPGPALVRRSPALVLPHEPGEPEPAVLSRVPPVTPRRE